MHRNPIPALPLPAWSLLALPLLVGGCNVPRANAPSLLPRPIESRSDAVIVAASVDSAPDAAFIARMDKASAGFKAAEMSFAATLKATERRITAASRAAAGSDAWLDAQAALGELGGARGTTDAALADLEELAIARGAAGQPPIAALDARIASANAEVDRQNAAVERLKGIPRPL